MNLAREGADGDARGSLPRGGAFKDVADVLEVILEHAGEVGVAGARTRDDLGLAAIAGIGRHALFPVFVVAILDDEGDGTAHRAAEADARNDARLVLFDQHAAAAPVALLAARQVVVNARDIDFEAGWSALDNRDQFGSVRFAGGKET